MKKFLANILAIFSILTFCVACNKETANVNDSAIMLSSFESYYDIQKIALQDFTGRVDFEENAKLITEGKGSARITFLYETDTPPQAGAQVSRDKTPYIAFRAHVYADEIKKINDFDTFHIDIYNDNERTIDVVFNIQLEDKSFIAAQRHTLIAKKWNSLDFSSFRHFYPLDENVAEIRLYFVDAEKYTAKDMQLCFDNCYVSDEEQQFTVASAGDNKIISFNSADDLDSLLNYAKTVPAIVGTSFVKLNLDSTDKGSLRLEYGVGFNSLYDITSETQGYYLKLHNDVLDRIKDASQLSMKVKNAGTNDVYVSLIVKAQKQNLVSKVLIPSGETENVVLDISSLTEENITDVSIMMDNWNVMQHGVLYLSSISKT